jgi:hypothetical protein
MNRKAANNLEVRLGSGYVPGPEMVLLGGRTQEQSQTRVMAANFRSRDVNPADLDAFLQGYLKGF